MEQSGGLVSVAVYLAILAFAIGWFLLPRWLRRRKASRLGESARDAAPRSPVADSDLQ